MVDTFLNTDLNDLISSVETEQISLPKWLNILENNKNQQIDSITSQLNESIYGNELSATSENTFLDQKLTMNNDIFIKQSGGDEVSNNVVSPDDINNLIAMLTSEKNGPNNTFDTVTSATNTAALEDQIKNALNSVGQEEILLEGGAKKLPRKLKK